MTLSAQTIQQYYEAQAGKLLNWLMAMGMTREVASEAVQEAFLKLWERRGELADEKDVPALLFTVARNNAIDIYRKDKPLVFPEEDFVENIEGHEECAASHDVAYLRGRLRQALAQLPQEQAEAYTLFQVACRSIKQIAEITGSSENLVKVRIHRAKERLAQSLADLREDWS